MSHLEEAVEVGVIERGALREGVTHVVHGCLAVALQVGHDVGRVVPPQQVQHLHRRSTQAMYQSKQASRSLLNAYVIHRKQNQH